MANKAKMKAVRAGREDGRSRRLAPLPEAAGLRRPRWHPRRRFAGDRLATECNNLAGKSLIG
ncbi:hypothetical protein BV133_1609 [Blastochloris viridis]|uniref:Uncharacterized protein n=1 Tax=Blastochloris viridis TaxID=1079 RepID=A0A182D385_BLAVI|nr:hypothetical protein BV133_1609 [Blastochloris viridis]